jgi:hypothetical protein
MNNVFRDAAGCLIVNQAGKDQFIGIEVVLKAEILVDHDTFILEGYFQGGKIMQHIGIDDYNVPRPRVHRFRIRYNLAFPVVGMDDLNLVVPMHNHAVIGTEFSVVNEAGQFGILQTVYLMQILNHLSLPRKAISY